MSNHSELGLSFGECMQPPNPAGARRLMAASKIDASVKQDEQRVDERPKP